MAFPSPEEAERLLAWAGTQNPGPWTNHSYSVATAAQTIARACGLDGDKAFSLGLLHDLGRYMGVTSMKHVYDGYALLRERGYDEAAQICLTHSFPTQDIAEYSGANDCSPDEYRELSDQLSSCTYTDYDLLIQLCDSIALVDGVCLMEKRLVDVARRHGTNEQMLAKWERLFAILARFDAMAGKRIYSLFPDIVNNTFN